MIKIRRFSLSFLIVLALLFLKAPVCHANIPLIFRGLGRTLISVFEIPRAMVEHSGKVMFPFGIVTGAVEGSVRTVFGTLGGVLDVAQGAAPLAKYLVFFI